MGKLLVLRVREDDEITDILQLPLAHLHSRLLCSGVVFDVDELDDQCLNYIHEHGTRHGRERFVGSETELTSLDTIMKN